MMTIIGAVKEYWVEAGIIIVATLGAGLIGTVMACLLIIVGHLVDREMGG